MEIYRTYVATAEAVSHRRGKTNTFFLAVNSTLVTVHSLSLNMLKDALPALIIGAAGIVLCICWQRLLRSYKGLNAAKFSVICELEKSLGASPFSDEWSALEKKQDGRDYVSLSKVEETVPWVFLSLYVAVILTYLVSVIL